jgi:hypothetical protein
VKQNLIRIALGLSVVVALAPAVALTTADSWPSLWSTDDAVTGPNNLPLAAVSESSAQARESETTSVPAELRASDQPELTEGHQDHPTTSTAATDTSSSVNETTESTAKPGDGGGTNTNDSSPPTTHGSDHSDGGSPIVEGTITGNACPCTVSGSVELKGSISLEGDLIVMGGTLVARPGVNVNGNGFQIMFMNGGKADFQGSKTSTWSGNGSNANLSRDITFSNLRRIMFHEGAGKSTLRYFSIKDSGTSQVGDYSLHFHLNGNSTRGTLVEGVVVLNSRHHAFVPHASHGITFRDTIAKNGRCEAYWWDPPEFQSTSQVNNSNDTVYEHALADGVTNCPGDDRGFRLSAFSLGAGNGNSIRNSVARNVSPSHAKDCSGFNWPELSDKQPSSWTFTNNASYGSKCNGIFVWQNDNEQHIVNGFSGDGIDHGAYLNRYDYRNLDVEFIEVHALGWSVTGGSTASVAVSKHNLDGGPVTFSNIDIGSFVVNNAGDGGSTPGTYVLNGTGLACDDIVYHSVVPGTEVVIDGAQC